MSTVIASSNESKCLIVNLVHRQKIRGVCWWRPHNYQLNFKITFPTTQMQIVFVQKANSFKDGSLIVTDIKLVSLWQVQHQ